MENQDKDISTTPEAGSTRTEKCESCDNKCEKIYRPEVKRYMAFMKREMIVEPGGWYWSDEEDKLEMGECENCRKTKVDKRRAKERADFEMKIINDAIEVVGGKLNFERFTFDKFEAFTESQQAARDACVNFNSMEENLLLIGPAGVGKTHLATATLKEFYLEYGKGARYRITELLRLLRYKRSAEAEADLIKEFISFPVLVIEDFGVQKATDWSTAILWEIIDRRLESGRNGLIITSNVGRGKMAETMGDKITSRLSSICRVIKVDGLDMRTNQPPPKELNSTTYSDKPPKHS